MLTDREFSLEVCVDNVVSLHACVAQSVQRVELCAALPLGGLTPNYGLLQYATRCPVPVMVMIRPRAGDFIFNTMELELMCDDIAAVQAAGLHGVVLGASTVDAQLDIPVLEQLCTAAGSLEKTLHRCIDTLADPLAAIDTAIALGFDRILTSGGARTALLGNAQLAACQHHAAGRIEIMAGAGLTPVQAERLWHETGIEAFHASCTKRIQSNPALTELGFSAESEAVIDADTIKDYQRTFARLSRLQSH